MSNHFTHRKGSLVQIKLSFKQENFDWKVKLEGSNDNKVWFTVVTDYRILAIKNSNTDILSMRIGVCGIE